MMRENFKAAIILFIISTSPFAGQFSVFTLIVLSLLILLSLFFEKRKFHLSNPIKFAFLAIYLVALYFDLGGLWGLEAGVSFLSFLALLKSFEIKEKRDLFVFSLIVQLSLVGHLLSVDDLYMVLVLILITVNLFWLLYQFYHFGDRRQYSKEVSLYRRRIFISIILWSLPLAILLFFIFPRFPLGNLFASTIKKQNLTGFTDQLRPGEINKVIQSKTTYFRVKFDQLRPNPSEFYWRGLILSKTDGFNWDKTENTIIPEIVKEGKKPLYNYEVEYEFFANGPLFLLDAPLEYDLHHRSHTVPMGGDTYYTYPYRNQKIRYRASSVQRNHRGNSANKTRGLSKRERETFLETPKSNPNTQFTSWVKENFKGDKSVKERLEWIEQYLDTQKFSYSLSPGVMNPTRPLDDFFFSKKVGLCEHYASVVALILRYWNIPSRVIVGFQGAQYNPYGEFFYVGGMNAHAWVEYWSQERGWQRIDPTQWINPTRISYGAQSYFTQGEELEQISGVNALNPNGDIFKNIMLMADMVYYELNREFLNFDLTKQEEVFQFLNLEGKFKYLKLVLLALGVVAIILIIMVIQIFRGRTSPLNEREKLLKKMHLKLKKKGIVTQNWWGPQKLAFEIQMQNTELSAQMAKITSIMTKMRYQDISEKDRISLFKELKGEISKI